MSNSPVSLLDEFDLPEWDALNPAQVELSLEQVQRAAQLSQTVRESDKRWQAYLSALGTLGFQQWLQERSPELNTQFDQALIWQSGYPNLMSEACNIQVGAFKVCLIPVGTVESEVDVSISVFDLPEFAAHFYVLMQAIDDEDRVSISGFLTYDQFREHRNTLQINSDWTYSLSTDWFYQDANSLLLNLRCLEPDSIQLPALEPIRSTVALREKLAPVNLQKPWETLTVEEGLTLLSDPSLVRSLYTSSPSINVRLWLQNRIDTIAQELGWMLMPNFAAVRSLREEFDQIRSTLEAQGVHIPSAARGAYRTLRSTQGSFRFYAVAWIVSEDSDEWMLLVTLGAEPGDSMPESLKLSIRDDTSLLFEQSLEQRDRSVLYAQVVGNWNEKFNVTVTANQTDKFEIPPFGFELD